MTTSTPTPTNPAAVVPRRVRFGRLLGAALVVTCAVGGAAGSVALRDRVEPTPVAEEPEPLTVIVPAKGEPVPDLAGALPAIRIDTLLRAGCYADALQQTRDAPPNTFGPDECSRAYREGLCLEGLGRLKEADAAYQKAEADANVGAWARAMLGRARCAIARDSYPAAQAFVERVILRSGHPECRGTNVYEEACYLRVRLAVLEAGPVPALDPLDADALAWPSLHVAADKYLDWLPTDTPTVSPVPESEHDVVEMPIKSDSEATAEALRHVLTLASEHPAAGAMRVTLANLDLRAGRVRSAARSFKQVIESGTSAPEATHAAYNLGLLELKEGNVAGARARFLEVIDRAPGTRWADLAWCWIARAHLDGGDTTAARAAYRTAFDGKTREATSAAALGLCTCDLLDGTDEAPRELIRDTRFSTRVPHATLAAFFEALLRYRGAPTESRRELLLTALGEADDARRLGPAGTYLAGRVYRELGLAQRTCDLYDTAADTARGPLVLRMTFETAERYDQLDMRKQARTRYTALAAADPEGLGASSELRLAALDTRDGNGAEAVRRCRALVNRTGVDRAAVLAVMGRGYELQRKFAHAAECFAGRVPGE